MNYLDKTQFPQSKAGVDYGLGVTNIDVKTGIRYGVISQNTILQAWADSSEPIYPEEVEEELDGQEDLVDESGRPFEPDVSWLEDIDPIGYEYVGDGYVMSTVLDADIMITASPYYTFAKLCSPCVPGAGNLDEPSKHGVKTFCVGHDWFEDGVAPYPVFLVSDDSEVNDNAH